MAPLDSLRAALADRYRLDRQLGQGGMATVYLAHDLKLDRDVALKVLRPELAAVLGRDRFLGEIRLTAKLDHPHILTLIASGEDEDFLWYVLPYVRGESLRDRLTRDKQLGVEEALAITKQIAGALDYAHQHGVIHRDIKPENILLHEGEAMLADFGIALAVREAAGNRLTETGLSLGTPQYMSPEQATGERQLDARSDVYSLAAVLYEMLAGEPPLSGPTAQAIIAKLMTERPTRLRVVRDTVPEGVDTAVARALAKVPADRFGSANEFVKSLGASAGESGSEKRKVNQRVVVISVTALVAVAAVVTWRVGRGHNGGRFEVQDRTQVTFTGNASIPAISADGKQVAYLEKRCVAGVCTSGIDVLDFGTGSRRRILDDVAVTPAGENIRWSRDRRFLLFLGKIGTRSGTFLVSTLGDNPRPISIRTTGTTLVPGQDSLLIVLTNTRDSVAWVAMATLAGEYRDSVPIHLGKRGELLQSFVWPGGQWMVVETIVDAEGSRPFRHEYRVVDRLGHQRDVIRVPEDDGTWAVVRPDAFWMQLVTSGEIIRIPFDAKTGRFTTAWDTVLTVHPVGFDVTEDGRSIVYWVGTSEYEQWALDLADALKGNLRPGDKLGSSTSADEIALSPDGTRLLDVQSVATAGGGGSDIVLRPFRGGADLMHWLGDSLGNIRWKSDGQAFSYAERVAGKVRMVTVDVRTGMRQSPVEIPDPHALFFIFPISDSEWAWPSGRSVHLWRKGEPEPRSLPLLTDELWVNVVTPDPHRSRLAVLGGTSFDSLFLDVTVLPEGETSRWATLSWQGQGYFWAWWLGDGSLVVWIQGQDRGLLYRVTGPGRVERLGNIPRSLAGISLSQDGRRVVLVTQDFRGDVWLAHLKRTGGN